MLVRGGERDYIGAVRLLRKLIALALVAIWPAVTSHSLLERLDLIHVVYEDHHHHDDDGKSHEHDTDNHRFADGDYTLPSPTKSLSKPNFSIAHAGAVAFVLSPISLDITEAQGPAPPGVAPPLLQKSWHFSLRAALPVRAPSFIS